MIDDTDRRILAVLLADARTSMRSIAEEVGVALGTVSNRVKRMEEMGVIHGYGVHLDAEKVGWTMTVLCGLRIEKGRLMEVQRRIADDPRVFGIYDVTGEFDSMVLARVRDRAHLDDLSKTVLSSEGIIRTVTHVVLNTVKQNGVELP
ncbi:MAG TPA: Lrp/AsnC family transcriptional regulator [Candidatus Thalassarchaeaceae archaeon]|jgi:DNA-binding Lrp family transcriptional regulator|nr:Lrp/AsnC family transcriptional regulator [Candidatus Thalassarchaeaceae archaeon]MDP6844246.1 Lrp/AsnC family transcriptional regulator [Candidatus Thalassarchaeaceae archaeon]HJM40641.1 Lrp/AsnC family transcriptional regulator [Candidatus Thalassarchaeaceae archaeon]